MKINFFLNVQKINNAPPIQVLSNEYGQEYNTKNSMATYATTYYQELFVTQGSSLAYLVAQNYYWCKVPKLILAKRNQILITSLTKAKAYKSIKTFLSRRALVTNELHAKFFLKIWNIFRDNLLEVFTQALYSSIFFCYFNSRLFCLIFKERYKNNLKIKDEWFYY